MALGTAKKASDAARPSNQNFYTIPVSVQSDWQTVIDAGGVDGADATPITNPAAEMAATDHHALLTEVRGTTVLLRVKYDDGISAVTPAVIQVFGGSGTVTNLGVADIYEPLFDAAGNHQITMTVDTTNDVSDGTFNWTDPVELDFNGCAVVIVGIHTAFSGTGTYTTATLEAKIK